jgi:hypothetical protein
MTNQERVKQAFFFLAIGVVCISGLLILGAGLFLGV